MSVPRARDNGRSAVTIEIDQLDSPDAVLVTLRTDRMMPMDPVTSVVTLSGCRWLEELPEVLRAIGLALVYDDPHWAHHVVGRLLEDLSEL